MLGLSGPPGTVYMRSSVISEWEQPPPPKKKFCFGLKYFMNCSSNLEQRSGRNLIHKHLIVTFVLQFLISDRYLFRHVLAVLRIRTTCSSPDPTYRILCKKKIDIFQIVNFSFFLKLFIQNLFVKIQIDLFYSEFLFFCTEYFGYILKIVKKKLLVVT